MTLLDDIADRATAATPPTTPPPDPPPMRKATKLILLSLSTAIFGEAIVSANVNFHVPESLLFIPGFLILVVACLGTMLILNPDH